MDDSTSSNSIFQRAVQKFQEKPLFYIATGVLSGIAATGAYGLRKRKMRLSLYLINVRLAAQGSFVGIMTLGVVYTLGQHYFGDKNKANKTER